MMNSRFVFLFTLLSLGLYLVVQVGQNPPLPDMDSEEYYQMEDFSKVKKFDIHIHINTEEAFFIEQAQADNFQFLDIVDDRPFGLPMEVQQKIAMLQLKSFSKSMAVATTVRVK